MSTPFSHFSTKINQITPLEHDFTEVLEAIALKPKTLYFRGKMPENMAKAVNLQNIPEHNSKNKSTRKTRTSRPHVVAIVGSRHNTSYGEEVAYKLSYDLAKQGVIIVSGLAFGIDSIAHRGCLDAGGTTIAVLGTRIDDIYPRSHRPLAQEILQKDGAIISEYAPAGDLNAPLAPAEAGWDGVGWTSYEAVKSLTILPTPRYQKRHIDRKQSFLYRNRLISGLADAVVVVEAAEKSGSLNTATHALEQGKEVFAVPGNITNPYSQGCNKLIRQGALPCTGSKDVLDSIFPEESIKEHKRLKKQNLVGDTDVETLVLQAIAKGARSGEEIMSITHLPPEVFSQTTTLLEIKGRLRPLGLNNWGLV